MFVTAFFKSKLEHVDTQYAEYTLIRQFLKYSIQYDIMNI